MTGLRGFEPLTFGSGGQRPIQTRPQAQVRLYPLTKEIFCVVYKTSKSLSLTFGGNVRVLKFLACNLRFQKKGYLLRLMPWNFFNFLNLTFRYSCLVGY